MIGQADPHDQAIVFQTLASCVKSSGRLYKTIALIKSSRVGTSFSTLSMASCGFPCS